MHSITRNLRISSAMSTRNIHQCLSLHHDIQRPPIVRRGLRCGAVYISSIRAYGTYSDNPKTCRPNNEKNNNGGFKTFAYVSGVIGAAVLGLVGVRKYHQSRQSQERNKSEELEYIDEPLYAIKPYLYKHHGYSLPIFMASRQEDIRNFKVRKDDIWVVSFPKAGTTWIQEIVYLIRHDLDFERAKSNIEFRFPYFEFFYPGLESIDKMPSPRCIKTHLPLSLLPRECMEKKPKIIYIARNSKDTVVSFYFFMGKFIKSPDRNQQLFNGSVEDFSQRFIKDSVPYAPWWKHVKEGWDRRKDEHILFITYEELKDDLPGSIRRVAAFLGKELSDANVNAIAAHCSFNQMKNNKNVNYSWFEEKGHASKGVEFIRKGQVGDWKNHLSQDSVTKLNHINVTKLEPIGLVFRDA